MPIYTERQTTVICDGCRLTNVQKGKGKIAAMKRLAQYGWVFNSEDGTVYCSKCEKRRKKAAKRKLYLQFEKKLRIFPSSSNDDDAGGDWDDD